MFSLLVVAVAGFVLIVGRVRYFVFVLYYRAWGLLVLGFLVCVCLWCCAVCDLDRFMLVSVIWFWSLVILVNSVG